MFFKLPFSNLGMFNIKVVNQFVAIDFALNTLTWATMFQLVFVSQQTLLFIFQFMILVS
jgi:hypothetical protein